MNAPQIISRDDARAAGFVRYFTGEPCMRGHTAERLVTNTRCVQCHREKARESRSKNPSALEQVKARELAADTVGKNLISRTDAARSGLTRYFTGLPCARGHIAERLVCDYSCMACNREKSAAERAKNPEKVRRRVRESYQRHIEKQRRVAREYVRAKFMANPESFRARQRERRANDPVFAFKSRARQLVRSSFIRTGYRKAAKTEALLGCTLDEFRLHIERQFLPGMGWHNMHSWEIDHIVPMASASNLAEAESLNRFTNLRPLWRIENRSKHAKQTHLL